MECCRMSKFNCEVVKVLRSTEPDSNGNRVDLRVVRWNGKTDMSALAGRAVRLRFTLADADVYGVRFVGGG